MLLEICLALLSLIVILIIFQFCKCKQIENFDNTLVNEMKSIDLKNKLMSTTEEFITQDDISLLEESTLQMLSGIQNIKNKLKKMEVNEEIDDSLLEELNETINEEEDNDLDEEMNEDEEEEDDDVVEGFMERSTHNCQSFK
tara:strand:+ start:923 stop:1348 length:426 start_codon:yes stop_codon:yes gene_type:complete